MEIVVVISMYGVPCTAAASAAPATACMAPRAAYEKKPC